MIRMGLKGNVTTDSHLMKISASLLSHSDMFIAMSNSGNTSELISAAEVAKSHGAYVVAITNFEGSKLTGSAVFSTFNSSTDQSRNTDHQFINTQIATLF